MKLVAAGFTLAAGLLGSTTLVRAQRPQMTMPRTTTATSVMGAVHDSTQVKPVSNAGAPADSVADGHLDQAVDALNKGDKAASAQALQTGIASLEASAQKSQGTFKDKVLAQVGKLKALLPLIAGGSLNGGALQKAVGLAKLASNANQLSNLLATGSLIGKASQLTSGLSGLGSAMSVLGGGASTGQSLVGSALGSVAKLNQGGLTAKAAEPAVKSQIGSVLNFVKGAL